MPGRKWVGRSRFYFIFLFNLKTHFCFTIIDFIYIHNGKRKLKFATVSANLADCQFLFCFVNICWKMWKKVYRQGIVERVGRVTLNAHAIFVPVSKFAMAFLSFLQNPQNLRKNAAEFVKNVSISAEIILFCRGNKDFPRNKSVTYFQKIFLSTELSSFSAELNTFLRIFGQNAKDFFFPTDSTELSSFTLSFY